MSKGSLFWANASGKLGESVYYRAGGEQRNRTYVKNVKNPKTKAQMVNRIQMINLNSVYKSLSGILKFAFPNKKSNQSGWNAFVSYNKKANGPVVTKEGAEKGLSVPYGMVLAKGSIPSVYEIGLLSYGTTQGGEATMKGYGVRFPFEADKMTLNVDTFKFILESWGLPSNAKMTIVKAVYADTGYTLSHATATAEDISALTTMGATIARDSSSTGNNTSILKFGAESAETMYAVIFSYTDANGALKVNEAVMQVASADLSYVEQFLPNGDAYEEVLQQYGYNPDSVLSTR